jgi:hypothetical protein
MRTLIPATVVALTAGVLAADAAISLSSGAYLNLGSGVWLTLARDILDGVFYRPLWNGAEYGGTRYFPVLPLAIAGLGKTGLPLVAAGVWVSMAALVALAATTFILLRRLAVPPGLAAIGAALAIAPYFVHQTGFAIRSEPLAATFAILGMAVLAPIDQRPDRRSRLLVAAALFVCAFATKLTCLYGPAAATAALVLAGRRSAAATLTALTTGLALAFLLIMNVASDWRALESFRACALAGSTVGSLFSTAAVTRTITLIGTSHVLTAVFLAAAAVVVAHRRDWRQLPMLYFISAAAITAIIFTSPGTILTSQIVDAYVAAIVLLTVATGRASGGRRALGYAVLLTLGLWTAGQNIVRISGMLRQDVVRASADAERDLVTAVNRCPEPVLSESSLVPILAGRRPVLLDAFAFHVVAGNRPDVNRDLTARISRREFGCIVLEQDPATARGAAWYTNVNLTKSVVDAVLEHYAHAETIAGQRFYLPRNRTAATVGVRFQNQVGLREAEGPSATN